MYLSARYFGILISNFFRFKGWVFGGLCITFVPCTGETVRRQASAGDLGRGGAPLAEQQVASSRNKEPVLVRSRSGPAFITRWEHVGRSDLTHLLLEAAPRSFTHAFIHLFIH